VYGTKGTLEFDWRKNSITIFSHAVPTVDQVSLSCAGEHFGGDLELCYDFLLAMRDGKQSRADINDGIMSAKLCLYARESAKEKSFLEIP
jgi:predicted dehydrogenase